MKILLFTENDHAGGMDTCIVNLVTHWPAPDEFVLACNADHPGFSALTKRLGNRCVTVAYDFLTREKVTRHFEAKPPLVRLAMRVLLSAVQYVFFLYHVFAVRSMLCRIGADRMLIVAGSYPGGSTPRAAALSGLFKKNKKPIFVYHNDPSLIRWFLWLPEYLVDWLVEKSVSAWVTVSHATEEKLARRPALAGSTKKRVIYNGIPLESSSVVRQAVSRGIRAELGIAHDASLLLMLGTYEPRKGHEFLLRAFLVVRKEIPDAHLVVAGSGYPMEVAMVERFRDQNGLQSCVHLLGFRHDVHAMLAETDVLVVPSQHTESFGLMIVEALTQKVPVVATDVGGIPEVLTEGQGGYTVPLDVTAFARAVVRVLQDKELRETLGEAGYAAAKRRFDVRRMTKEYYELLTHES